MIQVHDVDFIFTFLFGAHFDVIWIILLYEFIHSSIHHMIWFGFIAWLIYPESSIKQDIFIKQNNNNRNQIRAKPKIKGEKKYHIQNQTKKLHENINKNRKYENTINIYIIPNFAFENKSRFYLPKKMILFIWYHFWV